MKKHLAFGMILIVLLAACGPQPTEQPVQVESAPVGPTNIPPTVVTEPEEIWELNICLGEEPNSLFIYDQTSNGALPILEGLYDGPFDTRSYTLQSVILEKMPSLADGDALFEAKSVSQGDLIVDAMGRVRTFDYGVSYLPSGCSGPDCARTFSAEAGDAVLIDQMVVRFSLLPGIQWSDGNALTAADSIYSFNVAGSMYPAVRPELISQTEAYHALDELTVEWRGLPGYRDAAYASNFFTPLPRHAWEGMNADELLVSDITTRTPLSYGPYAVQDWVAGDRLILEKNPYYYRANDDFPKIDLVTFWFVGQDAAANLDALLSGACDILDHTTNIGELGEELLDLQTAGTIQLAFADAATWEHLDFGIAPQSYDDGYSQIAGDRADFFGDVRTRRAIAMCLDRQAVSELTTFGQAAVLNTFLPPTHPLHNSEAAQYSFDVEAGSDLLEQVGWVLGADGVRVSQGVEGISDGITLEVNYWTTESDLHTGIAEIFIQGLAECGIRINFDSMPAEELFASGPDGLLFGRKFDVAQFAWPLVVEPLCYLYLGEAVPGDDLDRFIYSWGGGNLTGWEHSEFDIACKNARLALPGQESFITENLLAQEIFANQLPIIPLYVQQRVAATRPDMCGFEFDATDNEFWNLEAFGYGELCE
ncbi:MAG: hypothetical protein FVQ83_02705 [Chloroflexi bacterium]|nr:hypothetical protein [Chloroflexota bacterium]